MTTAENSSRVSTFIKSLFNRRSILLAARGYKREAIILENNVTDYWSRQYAETYKDDLINAFGMNVYYEKKSEAVKSESALNLLKQPGLILNVPQHEALTGETCEKWRMARREMGMVAQKVQAEADRIHAIIARELDGVPKMLEELLEAMNKEEAERISKMTPLVRFFYMYFKLKEHIHYVLKHKVLGKFITFKD